MYVNMQYDSNARFARSYFVEQNFNLACQLYKVSTSFRNRILMKKKTDKRHLMIFTFVRLKVPNILIRDSQTLRAS